MFQVSKELLKKYMTLAAKVGNNFQKGQPSDICVTINTVDVVKG